MYPASLEVKPDDYASRCYIADIGHSIATETSRRGGYSVCNPPGSFTLLIAYCKGIQTLPSGLTGVNTPEKRAGLEIGA
jgi:hypothetical protein